MVEVEVEAKSPLHIGGTEAGLIDQPTFKRGGKPVIPGSSLKGAARSALEEAMRRKVREVAGKSDVELAREVMCILEEAFEKLGNVLGEDLATTFKQIAGPVELEPYAYFPLVCDPLSGLHCNPPLSARDVPEDRAETVRLFASVILLRRVSRDRLYCPVCTLFGGNGHPSPLIFKDAVSADANTALQTRVSIDRLTGAAKQERLFTVEYVPPNNKFEGEVKKADPVSIYTPQDVAAKAEEYIKKILPCVKTLGKFKSVGYGEVEVKADNSDKCEADQVAEELRKMWIEGLDKDLGFLKELLQRRPDADKTADVDKIVEIVKEARDKVLELLGICDA